MQHRPLSATTTLAPASRGLPIDVAARTTTRIAVIIPALNEQETIASVVSAIPRSIPGIGPVQVIVVDDGSRDETRARALAAGADRVASHPRNRGLVAAFRLGVSEALRGGADVVVNLDADGQHDPAYIAALVFPIVEGDADMVVGVRPLRDAKEHMTPVRRQGNRMGSWAMRRALGVAVSDVTSGYRAFSREALLRLNIVSDYTYTLETLIQASRKRLTVVEVPVPVRVREVGESRMTRSVGKYITRTGGQALRSLLHYGPLAAFGRASVVMMAIAAACTVRFVWSYNSDLGQHLPSLLGAVLAAVFAVGLLVTGLLADAISANRRLLEDALYHLKSIDHEAASGAEPDDDPRNDIHVAGLVRGRFADSQWEDAGQECAPASLRSRHRAP